MFPRRADREPSEVDGEPALERPHAGRVYTTTGAGGQVFGADGKTPGTIPSPLGLITATFSGPEKKTLYGVANNRQFDDPDDRAGIRGIRQVAFLRSCDDLAQETVRSVSRLLRVRGAAFIFSPIIRAR